MVIGRGSVMKRGGGGGGGDGREGSERERNMEKEGEMVMKVGGERRGGR